MFDEKVINISEMEALILCGGYGTRFQSVSKTVPKGMAPIKGRPFLDLLVDNLKSKGVRRFVFAVSHLRNAIIENFKNRKDINVTFSIEEKPLGTGGAIKNACKYISSDPFLVLNGDSLCQFDLNSLVNFHQDSKSELSLVLCRTESTDDYGNVLLDKFNRIMDFQEKNSDSSIGIVSAGIYLMNQSVFSMLPDKSNFSLEIDFFQKKILSNKFYGMLSDGKLLDIGTSERYEYANKTDIF